MKIRKSYRFSPHVVAALDDLCWFYPDLTETEIIECAVVTASYVVHHPRESEGRGPQVQRQGDQEDCCE